MFAGRISRLDNYFILPKVFIEQLSWIKCEDFSNYTKGTYKRTKEIFFNFENYETKPFEDTFWEGHEKYIDIHYIIEGGERIDIAKRESLTPIDGDKKKDFFTFEGPSQRKIYLLPGDFIICYPTDIHRTSIEDKSHAAVKKIIFKIPVSLFK